jgi:hypothetical protein
VPLILAGEPAGGKTGLNTILLEPTTPPQTIKNLKHTAMTSRANGHRSFPAGRLDIYPILTDTPGTRSGTVIDALRKHRWLWWRKPILVFALSPYQSGLTQQGSPFDDAFIDQQRAFCQVASRIILTSSLRRRIRACVIYISKFDIVSDDPPGARSAQLQEKSVRKAFAPHIAIVEGMCAIDQPNVKCKVIIASSANGARTGWGVDELREYIGRCAQRF